MEATDKGTNVELERLYYHYSVPVTTGRRVIVIPRILSDYRSRRLIREKYLTLSTYGIRGTYTSMTVRFISARLVSARARVESRSPLVYGAKRKWLLLDSSYDCRG